MKKLEQLWQTLTEAERVALVVLADILTNRQAVVQSRRVAMVTAASNGKINCNLGTRDSSVLHPDAQNYFEQFLSEHPVGQFDELYQKLFVRI